MENSLSDDFHQGKLSGRFHSDWPDDVEVIVHEGGPFCSDRRPERMWVRVTGCENDIFSGVVLNTPYQLRKVRQGSAITFVVPDKGEYPLLVSSRYVQERPTWRLLAPCNDCGLSELFDPPSELVAKCFPNVMAEELSRGFTFTTRCGNCGGALVVRTKRTDPPFVDRPSHGKARPRRGVRFLLKKLKLWSWMFAYGRITSKPPTSVFYLQ